MMTAQERIGKLIKRFIIWYLYKRCGGMFHYGAYGQGGRYILPVTEQMYIAIRALRDGRLSLCDPDNLQYTQVINEKLGVRDKATNK